MLEMVHIPIEYYNTSVDATFIKNGYTRNAQKKSNNYMMRRIIKYATGKLTLHWPYC